MAHIHAYTQTHTKAHAIKIVIRIEIEEEEKKTTQKTKTSYENHDSFAANSGLRLPVSHHLPTCTPHSPLIASYRLLATLVRLFAYCTHAYCVGPQLGWLAGWHIRAVLQLTSHVD